MDVIPLPQPAPDVGYISPMRSFRAIASLLAAALVFCGPLAAMFVQPPDPVPGRADYAYGPFGEAIHATGPAAQANPWRWASKYLDEETGLYYFGLRYYDPVTGQWLSREPLGEGESVNLYSYCQNDPVNKIDVLGAKDFTLPDGTIDNSKVHNLLDFLDLMTTDFPLAVWHGLAGLPAQVNQGMAQARSDIDARTNNGEYGPGTAVLARGLQFMGSLSAGVTMAPLQPVDTAVGIVTAPVVLPYNIGSSAVDLCADASLSGGLDVAEDSLNLLLLFEGACALQGRSSALQNLRVPSPGGLRLPALAPAGEGVFPVGYQGAPGAMWIGELDTAVEYVPRCPLEEIARFRKKAGLPIFDGSKSAGAVARVVVDGQQYFGVNTGHQPRIGSVPFRATGSPKRLYRLDAFEAVKGSFPWARSWADVEFLKHAEAHALLRAARGRSLPRRLTLHVDKITCGWCENQLAPLLRNLGVEELTIYSGDNQIPIRVP